MCLSDEGMYRICQIDIRLRKKMATSLNIGNIYNIDSFNNQHTHFRRYIRLSYYSKECSTYRYGGNTESWNISPSQWFSTQSQGCIRTAAPDSCPPRSSSLPKRIIACNEKCYCWECAAHIINPAEAEHWLKWHYLYLIKCLR